MPKIGDIWNLAIKLKKIRSYHNLTGYNNEKKLLSEHVLAHGYVKTKEKMIFLHNNFSLQYHLENIHQNILNKILKHSLLYLNVGLIPALCIGDRTLFTHADWDFFLKYGISHLVAISGLHVTLISKITEQFIRTIWKTSTLLPKKLPIPFVSKFSSLFITWSYCFLSGSNISTIRACLMLSIYHLTRLMGAYLPPINTLIITVFICILIEPCQTLLSSFWLSFSAVACLLSLPAISIKNIFRTLQCQWQLTLLMTPITLFFFSKTSSISILVNLIAIPIFTLLIMPLCLCTMISIHLSNFATEFFIHCIQYIFYYFKSFIVKLNIINFIIYKPYASLTSPLLALIIILSIFYFYRLIPKILLLSVVLSTLFPQIIKPKSLTYLHTIDVGQGLSIIISDNNQHMLYDAGPATPFFDSGKMLVLPILEFLNIHKLDILMLSHGDNDHSGGANTIIKSIPVSQVIAGEPLRHAFKTQKCYAGQKWFWKNYVIEVLSPLASIKSKHSNDLACVIKISSPHYSCLLTSDISKKIENILVKHYGHKLKSDILFIGHHGSKTSSSDQFLDLVQPKIAIISSGYKNKFKHPAKIVLNKLKKRNIKVLNTASHGYIEISSSKDKTLSISTFKNKIYT
jgi:competence protein ComEC